MAEFEFRYLIDLCRSTHEHLQRQAARSVDVALVVRNWLFGWYIVEYEQNGTDRAEYGERLTSKLASALKRRGIKGCSTTNIKQFRAFYLSRREIGQTVSGFSLPMAAIGQTVSDESQLQATTPRSAVYQHETLEKLTSCFRLGWSHYVTLLTIGIVLCHRKNDAVVELTLPEDANIYASKYQLYLPSKEELRRKLMDWTAEGGTAE